MDRRKKILVNNYERATDAALNRIVTAHNAVVYPKVGTKDALQIDGSGITREEYTYALKSHFDFVVADESSQTLFAVEFDEPYHRMNPSAIRRDKLKNAICQKLGLPLLRIDKHYLKRVGSFASVLDWVIEIWFMEQEWNKKQAAGEIEWDQEFNPSGVYEWGYVQDGQFIPVNLSDISVDEIVELFREKAVISRPFDPFIRYRAYIIDLSKKGFCGWQQDVSAFDQDFRYGAALAFVSLPNGRYINGHASCGLSFFTSDAVNRPLDFATVELAQKLTQYSQQGLDTTCSAVELHEKRVLVEQKRA